jgi:hypothetical protein
MVLMVMFDGISDCLKLMFEGLRELVMDHFIIVMPKFYIFSDFCKTSLNVLAAAIPGYSFS